MQVQQEKSVSESLAKQDFFSLNFFTIIDPAKPPIYNPDYKEG